LQLTDINLTDGVLLVREGKGGKDRYVPIHHKLVYILKRYLVERKRMNKQSPYLFVGAKSDLPLNYKDVNKLCRKISRATGVKFTPHCLRHTFGSVAIEQDMGLVQLKEIMGHSNISSTMIYLKMSPQGLKDSLNRLELF
jgi:site-specific recombinase XerD